MKKIYFKYILTFFAVFSMFNLLSCSSLSFVAKNSLKSTVHINVILNNSITYADYFEQVANPDAFLESEGSGVVVAKDKKNPKIYYIITNAHVVEGYKKIDVFLNDGWSYPAKVIGYDEKFDLSLLSVESEKPLKISSMGKSSTLKVGDSVYAIGSPYDYQFSLTQGVVSYLFRQRGPETSIQEYIQTDVTINPGNSGGPLFNQNGKLVGINNWIRLSGADKGYTNISFSIPIDNVKKPINDFINYGSIRYKQIGINTLQFINEIAKDFDLSNSYGVFVPNVYVNSPAYKEGLKPGDVILSIDNKKVENSQNVSLRLALAKNNLKFKLIQNHEIVEKIITPEIKPSDEVLAKYTKYLYPGIYVLPMIYSIKREYKLADNGVFVLSVFPQTPASKSQLKANDIITKVNGKKIDNTKDFYDIVSKYVDLDIEYIREGAKFKTKITIPK